jgi:hypothetical protein
MSELSNALRHRLAAGERLAGSVSQGGGSKDGGSQRNAPRIHPDPDSLTAYLEQLLPPAERTEVLQHLAVCRECRDVLALSLPELSPGEDRTAVLTLPRPAWWARIFAKPVLGLAVSLAGLAIVATVIVELPKTTQQKQVSPLTPLAAAENVPKTVPAGPEASTTQPVSGAPSAVSTAAPAELHDKTTAAKTPVARETETATPSTGVKAPDSTVAGPYVNTMMFANNGSDTLKAVAELPSAPVPNGTDQSSLRQNGGLLPEPGQLARADAPYEMPSAKPMRIQTPPATHFPGLATMTSLEKTLGRDAGQLFRRGIPPMTAKGVTGTAMYNPARGLGSAPVVAAAPPVPGKDATELEQSKGFTTRALTPAAIASLNLDGANAADLKAASPTWKVSDSKLLKLTSPGNWVVASADQGIDYSVVSSHGANVWAGGGNAALVHSYDGGATWERITLGASASGTITSIEINGSQVHVKSSSGQGWSSLDGGKIWSLEQ